MLSAPSAKSTLKINRKAERILRRRRYRLDAENAIATVTHHSGGRQACRPVASPAAKARAAQSRGCRPVACFRAPACELNFRFIGWPNGRLSEPGGGRFPGDRFAETN